ncbi:hypothetical protein QTJ16_004062 [Diplocarpon rosae]|uniref:Uncharacterized protein n=1 Tax=Diplocarpon rosae TaxID=946125 RepID=A0AAD9T1D8_9HELO|nr:hypothetical protein QTJ16_004062 [Diplocarpon rosae]
MSNLFSGISGRFRGGGKNGGSKSPGLGASPTSPTGTSHNVSSSSSLAPRMPPLPNSPSLAHTLSMNESSSSISNGDALSTYNLPRPKPLWLNDAYAKHIVKGNFMTLSARPKTVEQGEWIAHQGDNHSFTWLNSRKEPVEVPAHEYISLMQRWISGKIDNTSIFPTDPAGVSFAHNTSGPEIAPTTYASGGLNTPGANTPIPAGPTNLNTSLSQLSGPGDWVGKSSGFPIEFFDVCQTIFRQMFRVYSHLYWAHFIDPFYHLNLEKPMNSCFSHFVLTATEIDMLKPHELEPMQPLIDLWAANGTFPKESKAYACANLKAGERLLSLAGVN